MKKYIKVERRVVDTRVDTTTCDLCKKEYSGELWEKDTYEVLETEIFMRTGSSSPEGGNGEIVSFDICPNCFKIRLIPVLVSMGAIPTETDWDF